jgi:serine/threonine protein kinase
MELIIGILGAFAGTVGAAASALTVGQWLVGHLRDIGRRRKTAQVLAHLKALGVLTEAQIAQAIKDWKPEPPVSPQQKAELQQLLLNLVRGARFHTTNGTPRSAYLRSERLIDELLRNVQPRRKAGESVAAGVPDWKLERFLGMGGFGEVWSVRNRFMPGLRACKFFTEPDGKEWIQREASALFHIKERLGEEPNVVRYLDIAVSASPHPYLMIEYVPAGSLEEWILSKEGDRAPARAKDVMEAMARGIARAHQHGISHRDLKPANVLLTNDNPAIPKITDFGLSRVAAVGNNAWSSSQAALAGTSLYLPPEAADPFTPRSYAQDDVFAFGVIWFQVLLGQLERPSYDYVEQLEGAQTDSRTIRLLSRCLAHPSRRFADGGELLRAMQEDDVEVEWAMPDDCFDVAPLVREYLASQKP